MEFDLIMDRSESLSSFAADLKIWRDAILTYVKASKSCPKELRDHFSDSHDQST